MYIGMDLFGKLKMTPGIVFTEGLTTILLALSPLERWQAARRFDFNTEFITETWFALIAVAFLIILIALFFWVSYSRIMEERKVTEQLFVNHAERSGLSEREHQILLEVVKKSGLKRRDAIFTMEGAFQSGAAKIIKESLSTQTIEESEQLGDELAFLREKLGFQNQSVQSTRTLSTKQLLIGRKLYLTRRKSRRLANIESIIIKNTDTELAVQLATPVESTPGSFWRGRYYSQSSVWEFDTSAVSCSGNILVLNHSNNIRFINRRRFPRVEVNKPAFIACFPFLRTLPSGNGNIPMHIGTGTKRRTYIGTWKPPRFVPATITELAGPGLRIETKIKVKVDDRVLVVFKLDDEEKDRNSIPSTSLRAGPARQDDKISPQSRMVEVIGMVKHIKAIKNSFSIAVESIGLSESDMNELVCATNVASQSADAKRQDISSPVIDMQGQEEDVAEPVATKGA